MTEEQDFYSDLIIVAVIGLFLMLLVTIVAGGIGYLIGHGIYTQIAELLP